MQTLIYILGTREQSYVYAIASSALVHSIARACSLGVTTKCSCGSLPDKPPDDQHKWGGCSDNVRYGVYLTTSFTEASLTRKGKPKTSKKADMNRHNNGAGAQVFYMCGPHYHLKFQEKLRHYHMFICILLLNDSPRSDNLRFSIAEQ